MIAGLYISYYAETPASANITIIRRFVLAGQSGQKIYEIGAENEKVTYYLGLTKYFLSRLF